MSSPISELYRLLLWRFCLATAERLFCLVILDCLAIGLLAIWLLFSDYSASKSTKRWLV